MATTARTLNGSGHFRFASSLIGLNTGTVALWVKRNANTGSQSVFDSDGARHAYSLQSLGTSINTYNDGRELNHAVSISTAGVWVSVVIRWNKTGNVQRVNINGVEASTSGAGGTWNSTALGTYGWIGCRYAENEIFDGAIACPALYNAVISDGDVTSLAGGAYPNTVAVASFVEMWDFAGASPEVGTNANNLTILGTSSTTTGPTLTAGGSTFVPQVIMVL